MSSRNRLFAVVTLPICAAILLAGAWFAGAGDLNPPMGPVAPTQRTPVNANMTPGDADSIFKITQPGSYYLTGNIQGVAAKHGIEIAIRSVTLDLNGFELLGVAGTLDGIVMTGLGRDFVVRNGSVFNWDGDGIDASLVTGGVVEDVQVISNEDGIKVFRDSTVRRCIASENGDDGIVGTANNNTVSDCKSSYNVGDGIEVNFRSFVYANTSYNNGQATGDGAGIHVLSSGSRIEGNTVIVNDRGIDVDGTGNLIIENSAFGDTYDIVAGNSVGPVVTAATIAGSSNPHANYSH